MRLLALLLFLTPGAHARWIPFEAFRFQPVDEADRDPSFFQFRLQLIKTVDQRDEKALLAATSNRVRMSVLDESKITKGDFIKHWRLDNGHPRESELWELLRDVLRLGGVFEEGRFKAPYVYSCWPKRFPLLDFYAVTAKQTQVYRAPEQNALVLATLRQEIVGRFDELPNPAGWRAVRTSSGVTGYVRAEDTRSPLNWRAVFRKEGETWKLMMFAANDWEANERFK
jgi:hypothetical protein